MQEFIRERLAQIAAWSPHFVASLMITSGLCLWFLRRRGRLPVANSRGRRIGRLVLVWIFVSSLVALLVALGPMSPLVRNAGRLRGAVGQHPPDIAFRLVRDDSPHTLREIQGKVVLVNLWATWCPPCGPELRTLNRLQAAYRERGLVVLTLSDEPRDALHRFVEEHSPECWNGYVPSFDWLKIETFRPFTIVIDRNGVIRDYFFGVQDYEIFERKILQHLR